MLCLGREDGGKLIDPVEQAVPVPGFLTVDPLVRISLQEPGNHGIRLCERLPLPPDINPDRQKNGRKNAKKHTTEHNGSTLLVSGDSRNHPGICIFMVACFLKNLLPDLQVRVRFVFCKCGCYI